MKIIFNKTQIWLWLAIFLFSLLGNGQNAKAQWWKDTVWTKKTDQMDGFFKVKFSITDSLIVGQGKQMDLFFDAKTGNEVKRIQGNNEVFFINNDKNFVRLKQDNTKFEIFDASTYKVIDNIENDGTPVIQYGNVSMSKDQRYIIAPIYHGYRIWDVVTKKIVSTKFKSDEKDMVEFKYSTLSFNCDNSRIYGSYFKTYHDTNAPDKPEYYKLVNQTVIYDFNSLDSIGMIDNARIVLSNTCKYYVLGVNGTNGIEIHDFNTNELIWALPFNSLTVSGVEFSPDDKYLIIASSNEYIGMKIWSMETGKMVYYYDVENTYSNIDLSQDGKFIVFSIGYFLEVFKTHFDDVSVNEPFDTNKVIYPNPTNNSITVNFSITKTLQLNYSLYDEAGNLNKILLIENSIPGNIMKTFDVSDLLTGCYFLVITGENYRKITKIIIQN